MFPTPNKIFNVFFVDDIKTSESIEKILKDFDETKNILEKL